MNIRNFTNVRSLLLDNRTVKQTIFKNTFWLVVADMFQKGVGFLVIVWLARHFGPEIYGQWAFALSFVAIFAVFADFGFSTLTIREIARDKSKTAQYIDNVIIMKLILGLITLGLICLIIQFLGKEPEVIKLVYFLGIYTILNTFVSFFQSIFRANEKMQYETICLAIESLCRLGLAAFFILNNGSILTISYAYIGAALVGVTISLGAIWNYFSKFFLKIDLKICKEILKEAWPFALSIIFASIYFKFGTVLLSIIKGDQAVGIYNASYNLILLILLFPEYVTTSIYPYFSRLFINNKESLLDNYKKLLKFLFLSSTAIALFVVISAPFIIRFIYGDQYYDSIVILQFLAIILIFAYMAYGAGMSLSSSNLQQYRVKGQGFAALFNVMLNVLLIPIIGIYGLISASIISEIILTISYHYFFTKNFTKFIQK